MKIERAPTMTEDEARFMRVPPYIVSGNCRKCGRGLITRVYGIRDELSQMKLFCKGCVEKNGR